MLDSITVVHARSHHALSALVPITRTPRIAPRSAHTRTAAPGACFYAQDVLAGGNSFVCGTAGLSARRRAVRTAIKTGKSGKRERRKVAPESVQETIYWPAQRESNPHSRFRRPLSYPLNDGR